MDLQTGSKFENNLNILISINDGLVMLSCYVWYILELLPSQSHK